MAAASLQWWESELAGSTFADVRLGQRLRKLIERMGGAIGASLPLACQDWASTKAAYRFFSNDRVGEDQILAGHFSRISRALCLGAWYGPGDPRHDRVHLSARTSGCDWHHLQCE